MQKQRFSSRVLTALVNAVTGGSASDPTPPVGKYRAAGALEQLLGSVDIPLDVGQSSRVPAVRDAINAAHDTPNGYQRITELLEAVCDPSEYTDESTARRVAEYLNERLAREGLRLIQSGDR